MSEMIERAARAWCERIICEEHQLSGMPIIADDIRVNVDMGWREFIGPVRCAIAAMRDACPTSVSEGGEILYREDDGDITQTELAARVFRGMCDAALAEVEPAP